MGYLFLAAALLFGVIKGYCGKRTSGYTKRIYDAVCANILRMIVCICIGAGAAVAAGGVDSFRVDGRILAITALSGLSTAVFVVSWLIAVKKGAYMLVDVFCMLGLSVPIFGSTLLFSEHVGLNKWIGIAVLVLAAVILCSYNNSIKTKLTLSSVLLLTLCGLANGTSDFSQKLFVENAAGTSTLVFNFYTYLFALIGLCVCIPFFKPRQNSEKTDFKPVFGYILVMSVCLFLNTYTKTKAAEYLPSAELYPLSQGGALVLSTGMSALFFGERLTFKCIVGVVIAFAALLMINL